MADQAAELPTASTAARTISLWGAAGLLAAVSVSVSALVLTAALAVMSRGGSPSGPWLLSSQPWVTCAAVFLVCVLIRYDSAPGMRVTGAFVGIAAGAAAAVLAAVPVGLASFAIAPDAYAQWAAFVLCLVLVAIAFVRTSADSSPRRRAVVAAGLIMLLAAAVWGVYPVAFHQVTAEGPRGVLELQSAMSGGPILALVFGAVSGIGCALFHVRRTTGS